MQVKDRWLERRKRRWRSRPDTRQNSEAMHISWMGNWIRKRNGSAIVSQCVCVSFGFFPMSSFHCFCFYFFIFHIYNDRKREFLSSTREWGERNENWLLVVVERESLKRQRESDSCFELVVSFCVHPYLFPLMLLGFVMVDIYTGRREKNHIQPQ